MESGSGSKRPVEEISMLERKMREWGPRVIKARLRGERLPDFPNLPYDLEADEYRRRFPIRDDNKAQADADERHKKAQAADDDDDEMVRPDRQYWRKELYPKYLKLVASKKKQRMQSCRSRGLECSHAKAEVLNAVMQKQGF